ncbi:hypothetical protein AA0113_g10999 [Alternaria arborescens]|uniref:Mid2 domain-containing protein n=1 Tax=Alternaria arborescens TaxID=156630 RepID=A0A4Q4QHZ5_9PLEO|nr:hypothetical protein AA0112_g4077 [Alternaria arborescens]RYO41491.1 hypothetical protein AA0113_g10999 [Alternaria arborescens]
MLLQTVLWLAFTTLASADNCYWRNGGLQTVAKYQPCSNDTSDPLSHICCKIGEGEDTCLPNGICQAFAPTEEYLGLYFRESCTLQNWEAGGCQDLCSSGDEQSKNDVTVTPCDGTPTSEFWCCGNTTDCCSDPNLEKFKVEPTFSGVITSSLLPTSTSASISPSPSSPSTSSNANATDTPTPSPTSTSQNNESAGLSTGAKAGIGVGAAAGVIALIAIGVLIGRRSHKKKKEVTEATSYYEPAKGELPPQYRHEAPMDEVSRHEAPATQAPVELSGDQVRPHEAPESR